MSTFSGVHGIHNIASQAEAAPVNQFSPMIGKRKVPIHAHPFVIIHGIR